MSPTGRAKALRPPRLAMLPSFVAFGAPMPIILALVVIAVGLLFLRFVIGAAITLVKIALLVGLGVAVYLAFVWLRANVF